MTRSPAGRRAARDHRGVYASHAPGNGSSAVDGPNVQAGIWRSYRVKLSSRSFHRLSTVKAEEYRDYTRRQLFFSKSAGFTLTAQVDRGRRTGGRGWPSRRTSKAPKSEIFSGGGSVS